MAPVSSRMRTVPSLEEDAKPTRHNREIRYTLRVICISLTSFKSDPKIRIVNPTCCPFSTLPDEPVAMFPFDSSARTTAFSNPVSVSTTLPLEQSQTLTVASQLAEISWFRTVAPNHSRYRAIMARHCSDHFSISVEHPEHTILATSDGATFRAVR